MSANAIILISCPDQKGITASVTEFISKHKGNILHADQHIDGLTHTFFMRIVWQLDEFEVDREEIGVLFKPIADKYQMKWSLDFSDQIDNVAIFVSKQLHCLYDLLYRYQNGQFNIKIPLIISNHLDAKTIADQFGIPYFHIPVTAENKSDQEQRQIKLLKEHHIDWAVLARYHQILTKDVVDTFPNRIINIHHSFLPAFPGKSPYAQAYSKGVKVIGATSHFVTEELDQGPIIEQDTERVTHRDSVNDMKRKGEDLEKVVLYRALRWALERKILCYNNKTVVFD